MKDFKTKAAKASGGVDAWEGADSERAVMLVEFHAWLVKTRVKTEQSLLNAESQQRELAPFAQAGLDTADTPADVPLVVLEFASRALDVMRLRRRLDLLNVYYQQAFVPQCGTALLIERGNEAEVNALWEWFIEERDGAYE
jgi:hypothetical protein